ncbi:serine/threonine-protein kinase [Occallatibacter savannae]|uniref:serine/threonine-protein kinase n=1 Tax=Occallatibacter savannae TaxID=1002691 RepID=UPI000D6A00B1|nr:serine/threonine-protein kinase [Occallatibacter savannae]
MSDDPTTECDPAGSFNNAPTIGTNPVNYGLNRSLPATIGRYRIVRLLGEGGMGAVYEAEQDQPRRSVALKVIRAAWASPELLRRFDQESQALGRLHHSGIAQIYEAGSAEGSFGIQPFFAMELINGKPLIEYAEEHRLDTSRRLALMIQVCNAVQHAHQRGIIHRDLKPGNILVDESGQPKILDFGLAHATDSDAEVTRQTDMGQLLGTLAYMSPEQVLADPAAVDTRTDVYALGVILYELLARRMPYTLSRHLHEAVHTIQRVDPAPLSSVDPLYRGDIETIVAKALEKDKNRRYASAADLAADIKRYLQDEPITAKPASAGYQLKKFARRHKALVTGATAVFVVLVLGLVVSTWEAIRARQAEKRAEQQSQIAQAVNDFLRKDLLAQASTYNQSKTDPDLKVRTALDRAAARVEGRFANQPLVEASIRYTIGSTYIDLGVYPEAERQMERALALRRRQLGENNAETIAAMGSLAAVYERSGKIKQAEPLYAKAVDWEEHNLGRDNRDTLMAMNGLAVTYAEEGRYPESEAMFARLVPVEQRVFGQDDLQTLRAMGNLAATEDMEGKHAEAEAHLHTALDRKRRVLGDDNPETLDSETNLAAVYAEEGKYAMAEPLLGKTLDTYRRVLGDKHRHTINAMNVLAGLYRIEGKTKQAETIAAQAITTGKGSLGDAHPLTLDSMFELAQCYAQEGLYTQAEPLLSKALDGRRHLFGNEHPDTLIVLIAEGEVRLRQRRYVDAEAVFKEASSAYKKVMPDSWQWFMAQSLLGASVAGQKRFADAKPLLLSGYEGMVRQRATMNAPDLQNLPDAADRIVQFYKESGDPGLAAKWSERANAESPPSLSNK